MIKSKYCSSKNSSSCRPNSSKPSRKSGGKGRRARGLDSHAAAYARLLADPENAPLVHPTYAGAEGGYLTRAVSTFNIGTGSGETAGYVHFTPGMIGPGGFEVLTAAGANDSTGLTATANPGASPGRSFITSTASGVRCVAACLNIAYQGSELQRSGRIYFGNTSGGAIDSGNVMSVATVSQILSNSMRTPAADVKIMWRPNNNDEVMTDPGAAVTAKAGTCAALTLAFSGLASATGLSVRITTVWEWQPNTGNGMVNPSASSAPSRNTLDDVLAYLARNGERFVRLAGSAYGGYLSHQLSRRAIGYHNEL